MEYFIISKSISVSVVVSFFLCWLPFHIQRLLSISLMDSGDDINPALQTLFTSVFYISGLSASGFASCPLSSHFCHKCFSSSATWQSQVKVVLRYGPPEIEVVTEFFNYAFFLRLSKYPTGLHKSFK